MSDINPNSEYLLDDDKHRFVFKCLRFENAEMAQSGEFVADLTTGIVYVMGADGKLHSKAAEVAAELQALKDAGVIQAALAYENNSEVYSLYVRNNKCRLSEMLKLSKNVRYYAVRQTTDAGVFQYITGNIANGSIENVLVDVIHDVSNPLIAYTGTAQPGTLHTPSEVIDGHVYFIDMFDANRVIIASVPCQVIHTSQMDFSLAPDKNIVSLSITTNQDMIDPATSESVAFLYQGQALSALNIYVTANYADGTSRYINHELAASRLVINIPTTANSDLVGNSFEILAKYYTEEINAGDENSGYDDVNYASISATRKVTVITDVFVGVEYLLPVPFVRASNGAREIFPKVFAFYKNKSIEDVTINSRLSISNGFYDTAFGASMVFSITLGLGNGGSVYNEEGIKLTMSDGTSGQWLLLQVPNSPITKNQSKSYECCVAKFDTVSDPGTIKMRLQQNFAATFANVSGFTDLGKVLDPDTGSYVVPTHFRVRSVIDSSYYHTIIPLPVTSWNLFTIEDTNDITKKISSFSANNNNVPYPVLIEFLTYDPGTNKYTIISMHPFFTQSTIIS